MTPQNTSEINAIEPHSPQQFRSRPLDRYHHPDTKESPQFTKFCKYCRRNGHSISRCFKKQMTRNRDANTKSRQSNPHTPPTQTQKMFKDFFKNNQNLPNKPAPNTYVSPHRSRDNQTTRFRSPSWNTQNSSQNYRNHSQSPQRHSWQNQPATRFRSRSNTPTNNQGSNNTRSPSPYTPYRSQLRDSSPQINQLASDTDELLQIADATNIMDDNQFLDFVIFFRHRSN